MLEQTSRLGRYKAALSGSVRNRRRQHAFYVFDDDKPISQVADVPRELQEGCYIVGLMKL